MFSTLTIRTRLISTMALLGLLIAVTGVTGISGLHSVNASLMDVYRNSLASTLAIADSQLALARARFTFDRGMLRPDADDLIATLDRGQAFIAKSDKAWKAYLALPQSSEEKKLSDDMDKKRATYINNGLLALSNALRAKDLTKAEQYMMKDLTPLFGSVNEAAEALSAIQVRSAAKHYETSQATYHLQLILAIAGVVIGAVLSVVSGALLLRAIFRPLNQALGHFDAIAEGNLTSQIDVDRHDEMGALLTGLQKMQQRLASTVRNVRDGSGAIATASNEIAAGNLDLSRRTESQAASLEETASSLEELTSTVKQNSDNARQANQLAASASEVALKGGKLVGQVVDTMGSISASSSKIVDIIGVIDSIAFQTNILALNAAVEAARAGEQGRGFAVVASEVRNLAHRSASAAKDIKLLIEDSVSNVGNGSRLVNEAGSTMNDIVSGIARVTDIMSEIAAAGREQELGIGQINQAVAEMDNVTQQNAALVEQAAAASASLQEQADSLAGMVSVFKLDDDYKAPMVPTRSRPVARPPLSAARKPPASRLAAKAIASSVPGNLKGATTGADEWETF